MNIAIINPSSTNHSFAHRVRGVGYYFENLKKSLLKYDRNNSYSFCSKNNIPKNADIIHYPYFEPFFLTLPFKKTKKTVVTVHDLTPFVFPKQFPSGIKGKIKWIIQKKSLQNVDMIITDSQSSKRDIIKYAGVKSSKIAVVYLAPGEEFKIIHDSEFRIQNLKKKYNLPEKFVLYVGDVTWNKNLPRLLNSIKKIEIPLVMVGTSLVSKDYDKNNFWNADLNKVNELAENDKNIIRLGFVPTEDLVRIYNLATVFVMPSLYEGFGLPIVEAMSCGCPVITAREGSITEIAGDCAYYVDAYDVDSIAKGIREIFDDDNLAHKLSKKSLEQAKKFSWKKTAGETIECYKKALI